MTSYALPRVGIMTPEKTDPNIRREARTERRNYKFLPMVAEMLDAITLRDKISETEAVSRAVEKEAKKLPLLGEIACGPLAEIPEDHIEMRVNVGDLYRTRPGDYLLKAVGDSMIGDGIENGDYILIRQQDSCDSGEIAACIVNYPTGPRATLKKVVFSGGSETVQLIPMNSEHEIITINIKETPLRICGVRRGVIKMH